MKKALIHKSLLLLGHISLVAIQGLIFLLFTVSDVIILIFSIMLNSTCDDSVNTNTGLKCTSIDFLQLRTLWNNAINITSLPNLDLFIYLLFYVAFNSQGHIAMGSLQVEETNAYCTVNHRALASNYQLSRMKRPARDLNRRPQRLVARTLTTTPPTIFHRVFYKTINVVKPNFFSQEDFHFHNMCARSTTFCCNELGITI